MNNIIIDPVVLRPDSEDELQDVTAQIFAFQGLVSAPGDVAANAVEVSGKIGGNQQFMFFFDETANKLYLVATYDGNQYQVEMLLV